MKRPHQCAFATLALLISSSSIAGAQTFGEKGQLAIGAERLFGYVHDSSTTTFNNVDTTVKTDSFSLLSSNVSPTGGAGGLFYSQPRVAGDYFVIDRLSVGAALGYAHTSVSGAGNQAAATSWGSWTFAPRAGYVFQFTDLIGIWPRAGFTYRTLSNGNNGGHALALTLEAPVTFTLIPHVVFTAGPTFDIGLSGSADNTSAVGITNSIDFTATEIGLQTGLVATVW
jgi:hypothetical protein